jgi:hypothetical protein
MNAWIALRRPLLLAFVLGCAVSLMTSGRLTLRLAAPATIYWSFVPLCEIGSLALVSRGRKISFAETIDRFCAGHTAWLLWLIVFAAFWAFVPPVDAWRWAGNRLWMPSAWLVLAWSAYVDFGFFRRVLGRSRARAWRDLLAQRLLCWAAALAIFLASSGLQVVDSALGL